jgi:hypothetical protein
VSKLNLIAQPFEGLFVLLRDEGSKWRCLCECGNYVSVRTGSLMSRNSKSCGCRARAAVIERNFKHGHTGSNLYTVWKSMKSRCYNPKNKRYQDWGGRGIVVCDEWKENANAFCAWAMANGYAEGFQIDRLDNDGPYSPSNCSWVTRIINSQNKRNSHFVEIDGQRLVLSEAARRFSIDISVVRRRLKLGWPIELTLKTPVRPNKNTK